MEGFLPEIQKQLVKRSIPIVILKTSLGSQNWCALLRLELHELKIGPNDFFMGLPAWVDVALEELGIGIPDPCDYPPCLKHLLGRQVWQSTLGEVQRTLANGEHTRMFIKPAEGAKGFRQHPKPICY